MDLTDLGTTDPSPLCRPTQEYVSAGLDGYADAGLDDMQIEVLVDHLARCAGCGEWEAGVVALHRSVRLRPADPVPDMTDAILARVTPPAKHRLTFLRWSLAWIAVIGIAQSVPDLIFGSDPGATTHVARHLGSMTLALFVGFLYAAWRPHRAIGLLPVAGALAASMLVTAVVDISSGATAVMGESIHFVDFAGVVLLWMLAGSPRPQKPKGFRSISGAADPV